MKSALSLFPGIVACVSSLVLPGAAVAQLDSFGAAPINYMAAEVDDPIARLQAQLDAGSLKLHYDDRHGYLAAVLKALNISQESQTLVFSKTSLQLNRISPRMPRAVYFNDDAYVGWCQRGDVLELAATDAKQGAIFYTLQQAQTDKPQLVRDKGQCLSCHASNRTQNVPGYVVRSVYPDGSGRPVFGSGTFTTNDRSPFKERWGGWYVTGTHGVMRHMGNSLYRKESEDIDKDARANLTTLDSVFRTAPYLTGHSDIVALMVLEHQTQMHNAIAAANYETRQAVYQSQQMNEILDRPRGFLSDTAKRRIAKATSNVVRHLLFYQEFPLTSEVSGTSNFQEEFEANGMADSSGRSLRQFDLKNRLFRFPCSYLIYSDAFSGLPDLVRRQILMELRSALTGPDNKRQLNQLSRNDSAKIHEILVETLPEYADAEIRSAELSQSD